MGTTTTTFALNKPTVGGDDNAWGTDWNTNADKLDDLLDGTTGITPNLIAGWEVGGTAVTATAAELNVLDGVTASTAELNILDGVTASTAELNILDGVTASAAELNILDGATLTVTELNYVDGVTSSIQTQLDAKYDSGDLASQAEALAGTDNTKLMTPLRTAQALGLSAITTTNPSGAASATFTDLTQPFYTFVFDGIQPNSTDVDVRLEIDISANNGSSWTLAVASSKGNWQLNSGGSGSMQIHTTAGVGQFFLGYKGTTNSKAGGVITPTGLTPPINAVRVRWYNTDPAGAVNFRTLAGQSITLYAR